MRAIVHERYGPPEMLRLRDVERPTIGPDGVLVRVVASSVNAMEWAQVRGEPFIARAMFGLRRPKHPILGRDMAGVVEEVGSEVIDLRPGDEVLGATPGAFADYVAGHADDFIAKPVGLSFEQAAAIPIAGVTALQALRNKGRVRAGQEVLVLGAGGGVGSFAVQLAKAFGATVTATTSSDKLDMVRGLGADNVVDYDGSDVMAGPDRFDLILDIGGMASLGQLSRALKPGGTAVGVGGESASVLGVVTGLLAARIRSSISGKAFPTLLAAIVREDLAELARLADARKLTPAIDRVYPLEKVPEAIAYVGTRHARGKVVIRL